MIFVNFYRREVGFFLFEIKLRFKLLELKDVCNWVDRVLLFVFSVLIVSIRFRRLVFVYLRDIY